MLKIRAQDVSLNLVTFVGVLALPSTKTPGRKLAQELVTIDDPQLGRIIARLLQGLDPGEFIITVTIGRFRRLFQHAIDILRLNEFNFKPYSLRRGGATHDFKASGNVIKTSMRGRWQNIRTARIYIEDGVAALTALRLSKEHQEMLREAARHVFRL